MNKRLMIILLITASLAGLVWQFSPKMGLQWVDVDVPIGPDPKLYSDPFLLLKSYLHVRGYDVSTLPHLNLTEQPINADDTALLLFNAYQLLGQESSAQLLDWVDNGGTVVLTVDDAAGLISSWETNAVFTELGIELQNDIAEREDDTNVFMSFLRELLLKSCAQPTQTSNLLGYKVKHALPHEIHFKSNDDYYLVKQIKQNGKVVLMQFDYGQGRINLVNSSVIWQNQYLQCNDHGWLMSYLLPDVQHVQLLWHRDSPTLFTLIWRYVPLVFMSLLALLMLFLWRGFIRFGRSYSPHLAERRSLHEHLLAAGRYYYSQTNNPTIHKLQLQILQRAKQRFGQFEQLDEVEQWQQLSERSGVSVQLIALAMSDVTLENEQKISQINTLKTVSMSLR